MKESINLIEKRIEYFKENPEGCNWNISFEENEMVHLENLLKLCKEMKILIYRDGRKEEYSISEFMNKYQTMEADLYEMTLSNNHKKENWIPKACLNSYIPISELKNDLKYMKNAKATGVKQLLMKKGIIGYLEKLLEERN